VIVSALCRVFKPRGEGQPDSAIVIISDVVINEGRAWDMYKYPDLSPLPETGKQAC
jgi:hypothetical protein